MSAAEQREASADREEGFGPAPDHPSLTLAADVVEVRRNAGVAAVVGGLSSAVAIAYLARAVSTGAVLDWALVVVLGVLGATWLASFVDARTPLLVADGQGVRVRLGRTWRGLPWSAVARVEHTPRRGLLTDGRLSVVPRNPDLLLAELDRRGARQARLSTRLYGGPLAMPLGLTTRVVAGESGTTHGPAITEALSLLADRGAEVVVLAGDVADATVSEEAPEVEASVVEATVVPDHSETSDTLVTSEPLAGAGHDGDEAPASSDRSARPRLRWLRDPRPLLAGALTRVSQDHVADVTSADPEEASATPDPAREPSPASRTEVHRVSADDETAVVPLSVELVEDTQTWGDRVRPIAREGHPVEPLVFDDFVVEPAADPVVGPELRAARTRLALTVDQLADRTRIRPHVIEAIEVDDFVPCGGDFYARGHLRTLARVLGVDVAPLLTAYDERYAHAPIDARRVFEAELATGSHGPIRGTRGGANWSILVAAVMAVVLAWSVARLVMDAPTDLGVAPVLNGSGGPHAGGAVAADPVPVVVTAPSGGAQVVIRDSSGAVVFKGDLAIGASKSVDASPPVRVQTSDGSVTVGINGVERGPVGETGTPGQGTYAAD